MHASAIYFDARQKMPQLHYYHDDIDSTHDSAIRWEEVLGVTLGGSLAR